ncbi:DNA damage-regulated autophagy modulator protein 1-like isoform X2 [Uloborus diversus]|uniref:DNA damage-regulated autophagy modulator protein 1-like isoform X2 n=1 Tax=Uloborus diversus TaxID=327109 RepID=UPI0024093CB3|nr:DNA damage-regulated autophagy modulator protein 1-like isoform X2 [Uloborus diversus]
MRNLRFEEESHVLVGLVSCACWNSHASFGFQKCGFLMILLMIFVGGGLLFPYLTVLIRSLMPGFLPFISQAGGLPPSSGIFSIFMNVASFFGIVAFFVLYETINHRNTKDLKLIRVCNKIGLVVIAISCLGLVVTVANPVGYTDVPNKFEWVVAVLYQHGIGAIMILVGAAVFQYILTAIWWFLPDTTKFEKYLKLSFGVVYFLFFLITVYPMPMFILEELGPNPFDFVSMKNATYSIPLEYSISYKICAFCEWALVILGAVNFLTHYKDYQRVSLRIVLRHKSCLEETVEPTPSISLKVIA